MGKKLAFRFREIVGMRGVQPGLDGGRRDFGEVIADDFRPSRVEHGLAGLHVPFPGADFTVVRSGNRYDIRGRSLAEGD